MGLSKTFLKISKMTTSPASSSSGPVIVFLLLLLPTAHVPKMVEYLSGDTRLPVPLSYGKPHLVSQTHISAFGVLHLLRHKRQVSPAPSPGPERSAGSARWRTGTTPVDRETGTVYQYRASLWESLFGSHRPEEPARCACSCGLPNRRMRVMGGHYTEFNEYPWTATLLFKGHFYCGGTLISDSYVLTAAHCILGVNVKNLNVVIGDHMRSFPIETHHKRYKVVYYIWHHDFNRTTFNNDIAVVKLAQKVAYKWYSRPACLPLPNSDYVGELAVVAGWGRVEEKADPSDVLREAVVPIFSNSACRNLRYDPEEITENMICAGHLYGSKDSCHGDSGGPLMWQGSDGKIDVIGVVSWGQGCGRRGYPGVYTRVSNYLSWIEDNTRDSCYCGRREGRG